MANIYNSHFFISGLPVNLSPSVSSANFSVQRLHTIARQHQEKIRSYTEDTVVRQHQEKVRSYSDATLNHCNETTQVSPESVSGVEQRRIRYSNIGKDI